MSEPRIAVKIHNNHFVTCFPMPEPRPDQRTFLPNPASHSRHRISPMEPEAFDYARTMEDHLDAR